MWQIDWTLDAGIGFLTLTLMEIVLGMDNIIFISILVGKLPKEKQTFAWRTGLFLALATRLGLLFALSWLMRLNETLFSIAGQDFSGRSLILLGGGLFLMGKAVHEIHEKLEIKPEEKKASAGGTMMLILIQIALLDIIFSLDSVITAVGMVQNLPIMMAAMIVAVVVMLIFAKRVGDFVNEHPTMKILALSFLILIGILLVAEGFGKPVPKGYIYFAMVFSLVIEFLNMRFRKKQAVVKPEV
ncbi:MAG: TerC family protein [Planctomycetota bacterium]|nr:TerC family protein [Planctomycetota bacterium]